MRPDKPRARSSGLAADLGVSLVDVVVAMGLVVSVMALSVPAVARVSASSQSTAAARGLQAWMRQARMQAIASGADTGVVFDLHAGVWRARICQDGNGNGLKRPDIAAGIDACPGFAESFSAHWPGATIAVDPGIPGPEGTPPSADPVRFGVTDIAAFTSLGTAVPGTVFVRSSSGDQFAVRVAGMTGRTRLLRFEPGAGRWVE